MTELISKGESVISHYDPMKEWIKCIDKARKQIRRLKRIQEWRKHIKTSPLWKN